MAIYHFTTKIVKASMGKCAVASAAYQAAEKLYDEARGRTFSYQSKDEVAFTEILLPEYAPKELQDRQTLWNEVQNIQNKKNSRYARQFEMALPNEFDMETQIKVARDFFQKNFIDKGMAIDWALHEKTGNHHIHAMMPVRSFKDDGSWAQMEKKVYALDADGNRIPEIDPKTGKQKVRVRKGKGEEKIWKRVSVENNPWNSRHRLMELRKAWADECNKYLAEENQIDHRSYVERGIEKIPTIHEGYAARKLEQQGIRSERVKENHEIRKVNKSLELIAKLIEAAMEQLNILMKWLLERRKKRGQGTGQRENNSVGTEYTNRGRLQGDNNGSDGGVPKDGRSIGTGTAFNTREGEGNKSLEESLRGISKIRTSLSILIARGRTLIDSIGSVGERECGLKEIEATITRQERVRSEANDRAERIRKALVGGYSGEDSEPTRRGTIGGIAGLGRMVKESAPDVETEVQQRGGRKR